MLFIDGRLVYDRSEHSYFTRFKIVSNYLIGWHTLAKHVIFLERSVFAYGDRYNDVAVSGGIELQTCLPSHQRVCRTFANISAAVGTLLIGSDDDAVWIENTTFDKDEWTTFYGDEFGDTVSTDEEIERIMLDIGQCENPRSLLRAELRFAKNITH